MEHKEEKRAWEERFMQLGEGSVRFMATRQEMKEFVSTIEDEAYERGKEAVLDSIQKRVIEETLAKLEGLNGKTDFTRGAEAVLLELKSLLTSLKGEGE